MRDVQYPQAERDCMTKTSDQMKALVAEFIKVTKIKYEDQTLLVRSKNRNIEWQFHVGDNIIVSKNVNRDDRIHINVNMRFMPEDSKLLVSTNPIFAKVAFEISEICTICSVGHQWIKAGDEVAGFAIFSHIDEKVLDRVTFHDTWDNISRVTSHAQNILRANFNSLSKNTIQGNAPGTSIYG